MVKMVVIVLTSRAVAAACSAHEGQITNDEPDEPTNYESRRPKRTDKIFPITNNTEIAVYKVGYKGL